MMSETQVETKTTTTADPDNTSTNTNPTPLPSTNKDRIPPSIYFGGASCGIPFYIGVIKRMKEKWGEDFHKKTVICGGSIGSIIAFMLVMDLNYDSMRLHTQNIGKNMIAEPCYFTGQDYWLNKYIDDMLAKNPDIYKSLRGRFQCGTTREFFTHQWHKNWESNEDLARCLKATFNIPLYCSRCDKIDGCEVIDGAYGFHDSEFPHGSDTLFVGANQTIAEINYDLSFKQMLIPNIGEGYEFLVEKGIVAFDTWDGTYIDKKGKREPNYMMLLFCWLGKFLQIMYDLIGIHVIDGVDYSDSKISNPVSESDT